MDLTLEWLLQNKGHPKSNTELYYEHLFDLNM